MSRSRLPDDCFVLPPGVDWTPVDDALGRLRNSLSCTVGLETVPLSQAEGRILGRPAVAARHHPSAANSAVDGYAFKFSSLEDDEECCLPLCDGRAAAGRPFGRTLPAGKALRILTGAALPEGADTVVLDESAVVGDGTVRLRRPRRAGINTRLAGEDIRSGERLLSAGKRLGAGAICHLVAGGIEQVAVRRRLRVAVLSTGDELRRSGQGAAAEHVLDSNRPMLLALLARWGFECMDLGIAPDSLGEVRQRLGTAIGQADAVMTTGGVSAGDEDHVSKLLNEVAQVSIWRIAVKPGRPLALSVWNGTPVFGLPGNPVAAFVCALIFALPALRLLAGGGWSEPVAQLSPAAFDKEKKAGRREYLRARLNDAGEAEIFRSEGSGLTGGLAWSDGLVELDDGARTISKGDCVRYLPYSGFGI